MFIPPIPSSLLAVHEASHALAADAVGLEVLRIEIDGNRTGFCEVRLRRFLVADEYVEIKQGSLDVLAKFLVMLAAGPISGLPGSGDDAAARWSVWVLHRFDGFRDLSARPDPIDRADDAGKAADALVRTALSRVDVQALIASSAAEAVGILRERRDRVAAVASFLDVYRVLVRPSLVP